MRLNSLPYVGVNFYLLPRYMSYVDENRDILTRLGWSSDPLLLWEKDFGQKLKLEDVVM